MALTHLAKLVIRLYNRIFVFPILPWLVHDNYFFRICSNTELSDEGKRHGFLGSEIDSIDSYFMVCKNIDRNRTVRHTDV